MDSFALNYFSFVVGMSMILRNQCIPRPVSERIWMFLPYTLYLLLTKLMFDLMTGKLLPENISTDIKRKKLKQKSG